MPEVAGNVLGLCGGTAVSRRRAMMIVGVRKKQISGMNYAGASHLRDLMTVAPSAKRIRLCHVCRCHDPGP